MKLSDGRARFCHQDQLQKQTVELTVEEIDTPIPCAIAINQNSSQATEDMMLNHIAVPE